jgi:ABC-type phosphate transport system permease subunit
MKLAKAPLLFTLLSVAAWTQVNVGEQKPEASMPFTMTTVATFKLPCAWPSCPMAACWSPKRSGPSGW